MPPVNAENAILSVLQDNEGEEVATAHLVECAAERGSLSENTIVNKLTEMAKTGAIVRTRQGFYTLPQERAGVQLGHAGGRKEPRQASAQTLPSLIDGKVQSLFSEDMEVTVYSHIAPASDSREVVYHESRWSQRPLPRGLMTSLIGTEPPREIGVTLMPGDSMEPTIKKSEMVIYERANEIRRRSSSIYVLLIEGDIVVQRVQKLSGDSYRLMCDNKSHGYVEETLSYDPAEELYFGEGAPNGVDMRVAGEVIWPDRDEDKYTSTQMRDIVRALLNDDGNGAAAG